MQSDLIPPDKAASYIHALIETNRTHYTGNVVAKLHHAGLADAIEHRRDENSVPFPAQFLVGSRRLVARKDLTYSFRLASMTPIYVWNGATTDFERKGLDTVARDPSKPLGRFIRLNGGRYDQTGYSDRWPGPA